MNFYSRPLNIFLVADSFSLGDIDGVLGDRKPHTDPLIEFSSPHRMANLVFRENDLPIRMRPPTSMALLPEEYRAGYISGVNTLPGYAAGVAAFAASGEITPRDWIVFSDAGEHGGNPTTYQSNLIDILNAASGLNRRAMTMFDYPPTPTWGQFDLSIGGATTNQAIVAAAAATDTPLIDMNAEMDAYRAELLAEGSDVVLDDGIHTNVWGQMKYTGIILRSLGITPWIRTIESLKAIAAANYTALDYGASSWSSAKAQDWCEAIYG